MSVLLDKICSILYKYKHEIKLLGLNVSACCEHGPKTRRLKSFIKALSAKNKERPGHWVDIQVWEA